MKRQPLRFAIGEAEQLLAAAGVDSPRVDAELLAAHILGIPRTRLPLTPLVDPEVVTELHALTERRAARVPLQHLLGTAPFGPLDVRVGPGVFVPRPETELVLAWALTALEPASAPLVFDLCTGSGALALAIAHARPDATVHAVDVDPAALAWARRNVDAAASRVTLHAGDVRDPAVLAAFDGSADLVVCNPPYVPDGTPVPAEVAEHDPACAVFGGPDGLDVIRAVVALSARLLRPGGALALEHDETHADEVTALLSARRVLTDVAAHPDLTGRPRFATARRAAARLP